MLGKSLVSAFSLRGIMGRLGFRRLVMAVIINFEWEIIKMG